MTLSGDTQQEIRWAQRPFAELVRLAWPIAVSMLSFSAMSIVDTAFVGQISPDAIAGVGLASLLVFTLACFTMGLARAIKTLTAQCVGANRRGDSWRYLGAGLIWAALTSAIALVVGLLVLDYLPSLAGSVEAGAEGSAYFAVRLWSLPLLVGFSCTRECAYGLGDSRSPMLATVIANIVNAVLDYLLIFTVGLGSAGAAWASLVATCLQLGLVWWALSPPLAQLRPTSDQVRAVWRLGLPTGLQFLIEVGSFTLTGLLIAAISELHMAAHQIAIHVLHLSFLPAHAIGEAGAVLAGQAVGAGRDHLVSSVSRVTLIVVTAYTAMFTIVLLASASTVGALFTDDLRVSALAGVLLLFSASFQVIDGAAIVAGSILRGVGDVRFTAFWSVLIAWLATPTCTYWLGVREGMGALGAWIGIAIELAVMGCVFWARLVRGGWRCAAERTRNSVLLG